MFWNKNKVELEIGDSVKFKDGKKHPILKIDISDWFGRVLEVYKKGVDIELDSLTITKLNSEIIEIYEERDEYPHILFVPKKHLILASPRDTEVDVIKAQDKLIEKLDAYLPKFRLRYNKWVRGFQRSDAFKNMAKVDRENSDFVLETFVNFMHDYEDKKPFQWNIRAAKEVLLYWIPSKVSAEKQFFISYSLVLLNFLTFLEENKYLKTKGLQKLVQKIGPEIVNKSQDSSSWGVAKSFIMGANKSEVNLENKDDLNNYMLKQQLKALLELKNKKQ